MSFNKLQNTLQSATVKAHPRWSPPSGLPGTTRSCRAWRPFAAKRRRPAASR